MRKKLPSNFGSFVNVVVCTYIHTGTTVTYRTGMHEYVLCCVVLLFVVKNVFCCAPARMHACSGSSLAIYCTVHYIWTDFLSIRAMLACY